MPTDARTDSYLLQREGQILAGRYRVTELLGVGAMGSVWLAEQMVLKQPVVAKFHEEGFVGADARKGLERFTREARTLSSVRHRNVCELYEVGQDEDGVPYLILERLEGRTLAARMDEKVPLPLGEALSVAMAVAQGLEAVHAAGVLHRDVKPENIFLHQGERGIVPKLIDFGLARLVGTKRITAGGLAVGTPGFMAPEQARGVSDLDARVDIYSLGVTLYEMLTDELPARGESMTDLMAWTVHRPPIPLRTWRPDLIGPVEDVVMKALERDRSDRFPNVRAMRLALENAAVVRCEEDAERIRYPVRLPMDEAAGRGQPETLPPPSGAGPSGG